MSQSRTVNDQITDAANTSNTTNLGIAPSQSLASLYQVLSSSLSLAVQNAVHNQQQLQQINLASTSSCVNFLLNDGQDQTEEKVKPKNKNTKKSAKK